MKTPSILIVVWLVTRYAVSAQLQDCRDNGCSRDVDSIDSDETILVSLLQTSTVTHRKAEDDVYGYVEQLLLERARREDEWRDESPPGDRSSEGFGAGVSMVTLNSTQGTGTAARQMQNPAESNTSASTTLTKEVDDSDLRSLLCCMAVSGGLVLLAVLTISLCGGCWPALYRRAAQPRGVLQESRLQGLALTVPGGPLGWIRAAFRLGIDDVVMYSGLDQGMFIQFCSLAMQILAAVGIPLLAVLCPLHLQYGDAVSTQLSKFELANWKAGSNLVWLDAAAVWYVVLVTTLLVFRAHRGFLVRRSKWLKEMPPPRSNTVLVESIPAGMNTDDGIRAYFNTAVFGRPVVQEAFVVKDTSQLLLWLRRLEDATAALERTWPSKTPLNGVGSVLNVRKREAEQQVQRLRDEIAHTDELNSTTAFVTFESQREALTALKLFPPAHSEVIAALAPPDPNDVMWEELMVASAHPVLLRFVGNFMLAILMAAAGVVTFGIAVGARVETLVQKVPTLEPALTTWLREHPFARDIWNGLLGPVALTLVMSVLPTLLVVVFTRCFRNRAQGWLQHRVQEWYFVFLVTISLLTTGVSYAWIHCSEMSTLQKELLTEPHVIFEMLSRAAALSAHFFFNVVVISWATSALSITRYLNVLKFTVYRRFYDDLRATQYAELEDQAYCGIGARSARATFILVVALQFCTLAPLITAMGFVTFAISRFIFAYLFVFAETPKPDLGGLYWVTMLRQVLRGLALYVLTMMGVLLHRGYNPAPGVVTGISLLFIYWASSHFDSEHHWSWELLQFSDLPAAAVAEKRQATSLTYKQPDLLRPQVVKADG